MKKEIITIAGMPGSGKSSTANLVAEHLGYKRFSSGDFMRVIARERGVSINELSAIAEKDGGAIDSAIDDAVRKAGEDNRLVIDSRLAFHWIPDSFKVYLDLPLEISKDRILENLKSNPLRWESEDGSTLDRSPVEAAEEIYRKISMRRDSEKKRYRELYGIDYTDKNNYDLVLDTNKNNLEQVVSEVIAKYKEWLGN